MTAMARSEGRHRLRQHQALVLRILRGETSRRAVRLRDVQHGAGGVGHAPAAGCRSATGGGTLNAAPNASNNIQMAIDEIPTATAAGGNGWQESVPPKQ